MLTFLNAIGIVIIAVSSSALGYFLSAIIDDQMNSKA